MKLVDSKLLTFLSHRIPGKYICYRHTWLCICISIWCHRVLYLLPFSFFLDACIYEYLLHIKIYRKYLKKLANDIKGAVSYEAKDGLFKGVIEQISKYETFQQLKLYSEGLSREKINILLKNDNNVNCSSYCSTPDYNVIIIPSFFDTNKVQHAIMLAHEFNHSMGHDLYYQMIYLHYISCLGLGLILVPYVLFTDYSLYVLVLGVLSICFLLLYTPWANSKIEKELDADIGALRFMEVLNEEGYEIKTKKNRTVVQEVAYQILFMRNDKNYIKHLWTFLKEEDKIHLLDNHPDWEAPKESKHFSSTSDFYGVIYDPWHALAFLIQFVVYLYCGVALFKLLNISWMFLFLAIIPYFIQIYNRFKAQKLWLIKKNLLVRIGCLLSK